MQCTPAMVIDDGVEILDIFILRHFTHFHESLQRRFRYYTPSFQYENIFIFIPFLETGLKRDADQRELEVEEKGEENFVN